ncbi:MAG: histidine--tRNA ligase [Vulcanimicrobiaceae bacterium]
MTKISAPRGTQDIVPPESARWQTLERRIHSIARRFGYGEIRTPMFEATELFVRGVGETTDVVEKEMYTFTDKGGRSMTLRPEWTAPVVRAVLEHNLLTHGAQRLYYVGPFFRYERPQAGRYRQANQFGTEFFGVTGPEADVEVIQIAAELLRAYAFDDVVLHLNSLGDERCRPAYRDALLAHFRPHREQLSADSQRRLERNPLRILDSKAPEDAEFVATAPRFIDALCGPCAGHFAGVRGLLDAIGIPYLIDPQIARGFDYYTRTVFEFIATSLGAQSTVCGGGRYDDLVASLGGPPTPAVGFGLGLERFLLALANRGRLADEPSAGIAVIALGEAARRAVVPLVAALRRTAGDVPVTIDYGEAKLATMLKRADRVRARAALIVGDDELAAGEATLRDLETREQARVALAGDRTAAAATILAAYGELDRAVRAVAPV